MRRTPSRVALMGLLLALVAACGPGPGAAPELPTLQVDQTITVVQVAPICQGVGACQVPGAQQYEIDCVQKVPYTNVLVEPGTTFEVLDKSGDFTCNDSGAVVNGKAVVTCFGKELFEFDLKLTNPACGGATLQAGSGGCQDGYGFDATGQCCAPLGAETAGSVVVRIALGACPLPR